MTDVFFTGSSNKNYWIKEETGGELRLVFYSYNKEIFFYDFLDRALVFIRSGLFKIQDLEKSYGEDAIIAIFSYEVTDKEETHESESESQD